MRLFARGCGRSQIPYIAVAEGLPIRDRLDLEAHAATCAECAEALRGAHSVDHALRGAFAPLRERRAMLAPGRVRLALGSTRLDRSTWFRLPAFFGRLAEVSVMVGVTLFVIGGSFEVPRQTVAPQPRSVIESYFRTLPPSDEAIDYFRWLRLQAPPSVDTRDAVRLPVGGRYDVDQHEVVATRAAAPR